MNASISQEDKDTLIRGPTAVRLPGEGTANPAWLCAWFEANAVDPTALNPRVSPGDWILLSTSGKVTAIPDKIFRRQYTPVPSRTPSRPLEVHIRDPKIEPKAGDRLEVSGKVRCVIAAPGHRHNSANHLTYVIESFTYEQSGRCGVDQWRRWARNASVLTPV
jgi:hypothetical protein